MAIERRGAEPKRRVSDHMFQTMFMAMDEGAVSQNGNGEIVAVNPAAENILGLTATEWIGQSAADFAQALNLIREDETLLSWELHPATLAVQTGIPQRNVLMGAHRPDGTLVWISVNAQPLLPDGESGPDGVVMTFRDVTERKRTEDTLWFVAQRGWMDDSESFFDALAQYLGQTLGVDYAVIKRLDEDSCHAETIAVYAKGAIVPNRRFPLQGTPHEKVLERKFCIIPQGIRQLFPEDALLAELGTESYAGLALWDSVGQPIGLVSVMCSRPLREESLVSNILHVVAPRVAAELERERDDRMLRQSEREFRSLAENVPDNVIRYDRQARAQYMNPALLTGVAPEVRPVLGESLTTTFPGNDSAARHQRVIEQVIATGTPAEVEFEIPNSQGEMRIHHVSYVAERDDNGEIVGALAIGRDITERKRMEQAVAAREQEFRSLAESSLDSIIRYDRDGRIRYLNSGLLGFFGMSATDIIGRLSREVWPDGRYAEIERASARAAETGEATTVELHLADATGAMRCHQIHVVAERDAAGQIVGALAFGRDITAIRETERQLRHFVENLPGMAYTFRLSPDGHASFPYVSPAIKELYGLEPDDVKDDMAPLHRLAHPDDRARIEAAIAESAQMMTPFRVEYRVCRPGQPLRWLDVRSAQERGADGSIIWYGIMLDITERKRIEKYEKFRSHTLELLSGSASLPAILEGIVRGVEQINPEMICSILLLDRQGKRLVEGIAPSLPDFYNAAIDGLEIGVGAGSCGTAAATRERVMVDDIQTHPYWAPYKELAARAGLAACWSEPIRSSFGKVLGTFAIYHRQARSPAALDISLIEKAVHLVSIAIERKRAEEALRASEQEFRTLVENLPELLIRYDREGRRTYVSPAMERVFAVTTKQLLGKTLRETNPTGMAMPETYLRALEHTLATGERSELELQIAPPGSDMRTGLCFIVAERAADGRISGAIAVARDITERKRMESEIRRREREFRSLAENSPDAIFRYDRDCRRLYANPASGVMSGHPVESLIGATPGDGQLLGADDAARLTAGIRRVFASGEPGCVDTASVDRDGRRREYQMLLVPEEDEHGEVATVLGIAHDITAIRDAERQMTEFVANLPGFAYTFRLSPEGHGSFPFVSPGIERLVGLKPADVKNDMAPLLALAHPDDVPRILATMAESARTMTPYHVEVRVCRPGLPERWIELRSVPLRQADGSVLWHGIMLDITERKGNEAELERHRHHLEELVEDRTAALSIAKETAEAATRAKTHFLAVASHDLRQPLQAIRLFNDTLAMSGLDERQTKIGSSLAKSVNSLNELLDELLDLSRLDAGIIEPQPVVIQADDLLGIIGAEFDTASREKNLSLNLFCPRQGLALFSDENLLLALLRNLVSNAVKYTARGGILVSIRRRGDRALIQVWDTGIGIAPEQMDSIFEEYVQIGNPERDRAKGVGLGLAIVKRLSALLDIEVRCRSRVGRGSAFELSVPLADESNEPASAIPTFAGLATVVSNRLAGKRIVIIEDDEIVAEAIKLSLEMDGVHVILFDTAEDALGSAQAMGADYYISDYRLPGMNGLQLLDAIQRASAEPIKALILTGNTSPDQIAIMQSSRWQVLFKPTDLPRLLSALVALETG